MRIENSTSAIVLQQGTDAVTTELEAVQQETTLSTMGQESVAAVSSSQNLVSGTNLLLAQTDAASTPDQQTGSVVYVGPPEGVDLYGIASFAPPEVLDQENAPEDAWIYQMPSAGEVQARMQVMNGLIALGLTGEDAWNVLHDILMSGQSAEQYLGAQAATTTATASSVTVSAA